MDSPPPADEQPRRPFPDADGYWVSLADFPGRKSFGLFRCAGKKCHKVWSSAHALKEFEQACQRCERYTLPYAMWHNNSSDEPRERKGVTDDEKAAHDRARCRACAAGVCTVDLESLLGGLAF